MKLHYTQQTSFEGQQLKTNVFNFLKITSQPNAMRKRSVQQFEKKNNKNWLENPSWKNLQHKTLLQLQNHNSSLPSS